MDGGWLRITKVFIIVGRRMVLARVSLRSEEMQSSRM